ncbi:MAG: hypothetical protein HYX48_08310 [Chlamydiales bacterium]|nr:hypothetical protein [Chlamydiales bacterium]
MSAATSSPVQNGQPSGAVWTAVAPYVVPPMAASAAIVPVFRDMIAKSAQQKGEPIRKMSLYRGVIEGIKAAPTVGVIVGTQMIVQKAVEKALLGDSGKASFSSAIASSAIVGAVSAPVLLVFNGQTMGYSVTESIRRFSFKQCFAIVLQETAFVGGLSVADRLAVVMKKQFGDNKGVEYAAAFTTGALGSLAGHPANTVVTRAQSGMKIDHIGQLMWGAARKARAIGCFSVFYKAGKELGLYSVTFK